jgi:hypothetical protein
MSSSISFSIFMDESAWLKRCINYAISADPTMPNEDKEKLGNIRANLGPQ